MSVLSSPAPASVQPGASACPRCGIVAIGRYCGECGSPVNSEFLSVRSFLREFKGDILGLEQRLFTTLGSVVGRPGRVVHAYREGRGALYVSPLRLYVLSAATYFAVHALTGSGMLQLGPMGVRVGGTHLRPDVLLFFVIPLYAVGVKFVLGPRGTRYSEALAFVLTFQSAVFLVSIPALVFIPSMDWRGSVLFLYTVVYLALGSRELWGLRLKTTNGIVRLVGAVLLYGVTISLCAVVALRLSAAY